MEIEKKGSIYGYCRISKPTQDITRQERNIIKHDSRAIISKEAFTGTTTDRPEYKRLLKKLHHGDIIIFDSVSRMSRNSEEGVKDYMELYQQGIELVFLKEPYINTEVYKKAMEKQLEATGHEIADLYIKATNEALKLLAKDQIIIAFNQAEKEVKDLQERTKEGLKTAKAKGVILGRTEGTKIETTKSKEAKEIIKKHYKSMGGTLGAEDLQTLTRISRNTFFKYVKELKKI